MSIEAALIKPVVDALIGLFKKGKDIHLKSTARDSLSEAIRELLLVNPNENAAEAKIAIAKAAGIISSDLLLAEKMLSKFKTAQTNVVKPFGKKSAVKLKHLATKKPASGHQKTTAKPASMKRSVGFRQKHKQD